MRLVSREGATLTVSGLDAIDGSPVLDIKPWYPRYDRPDEGVRVPEYVARLLY